MLIEIVSAASETAGIAAAEVAAESSGGPLGALGLNLKIFIAQLINFAIVLFVLWRWAWKPIMKILDNRSKRIEQSINDAKRIEEEMKLLDKKCNARLRETQIKAQGILKEAQASAEEYRFEEMKKTQATVERMIEKGKQEFAVEKERLVKSARTEVAEVVVAAAEKILSEKLDAQRDRAMVRRILGKI